MRGAGSRVPSFLISAAVLCLLGAASPARACDSTACAVAMRYVDGPLTGGGWRVDVSIRQVDQSRRVTGSRDVPQVFRPRIDLDAGFQPAAHEELRETMSFVNVDVARGITRSLSLHATLPMRRTSIESLHYSPLVSDGTPVLEGHEHGGGTGIGAPVAASNRVGGLGDLQVGVRGTVIAKMQRELILGLTVKLPTGAFDVAGQDGVVDPMLQPGSGSTDLVGSAQLVEHLGRTTLAATASFQQATRSSAGYRHGNEAVFALSTSRRLSPRLTGMLQAKVQHAGRHTFEGEPVLSTGMTLVQVVPGARVRLSSRLSGYANIQIPAYMHVNESQLGPRVTLTAGFATAF
jgi:hypothetical protein